MVTNMPGQFLVVAADDDDDNVERRRVKDSSSLIQLVVKKHTAPNLFARLPSLIARSLWSQLAHSNTATTGFPRLPSTECASGIEFLPLEIKTEQGQCIYVSYNGGDAAMSGDEYADRRSHQEYQDHTSTADSETPCCIELPACLCDSLVEGVESVFVRALLAAEVPVAPSVTLEAISDQDYTHIHRHADWLEQGGLLQQVSIVNPGQTLELQIAPQTKARLLVVGVAQEDDTSGAFSNKSVWEAPSTQLDGRMTNIQVNNHHSCFKLLADTEIVVLPPQTEPGEANHQRLCFQLYPSMLDYPCVSETIVPRRVRQGTALVNPIILQEQRHGRQAMERGRDSADDEPLYGRIFAKTETGSDSRVVLLEASDRVPRGWLVLHPLTRMELGLELAKSFVELECVALTDVQKLCTMPRYTGVQLEIVEMKRCLSASSWRYPSDDLHSTDRNSKAQELVDIRATWLNAVTHPKGVPIRVKSLFALPWDCEWSTRTYSKGVLCRVALEPDNRTEASSFASDDDSYVFTEDLEHLFTNAVQERHDNSQKKPSPSIRCSYGERVVFQGQFSLSAELSRRGTLYSGAITECAKDIHRSVLVCGGTSSGKTQTALIVAANTSVQRHVVYLDCRKLKNSKGVKLSTILHEFENLFAEAAYTMASTVVLDNLDELTPSYDSENGGTGSSHTVEQNPALKDQCIAIEGILRKYLSTQDSKSPHSLLLVVTSSDPDAISKNTSSSIGFGRTILLPNLQSAERLDMFLDLLCIHGDTSRREFHSSWHDFAKKTVGFRPGDLERLASRVRRHARYESTVSIGTVTSIELDRYVPLSKISSSTEVLDIKYSWEDVGGLFNVKRELMSTILRPLMYKQIYEKARIRLPRGILLFGPSGTGKSFIVPALAKKCGYPLIVCRGPELLSKYIGASESKVRELFARALSVAPSILFFDELDALAPRRGTDSTGVTDRVVNQLLTFLDGVEETSSMSGTVYIIASSSRPDKIDPALLRPGRLERHVYVGICEHETELTDLILQTARRNHAASDVLDYIRSGQMVHDLSVKAPHAFNFTAADLNAVFHTAHVAAAHEALALGRDTENALLRLEHVMSAFSATTPSLLNDEWTRLAKIYSSFRGIISQPSETSKNQELLKVALR